MRLIVSLCAAGLILTAIAATAATAPPAGMPGPDAAALWRYITQENPYQKWAQWGDFAGLQPGRSPHGDFVAVYVNPPALQPAKLPLAAGALVVKEGYTADKKLKSLTVMYKAPGYNPAAGDWYWVRYSPAGQAGPEGRPAGCIGCHSPAAANDYVIAHQYR
ncbi:MAG: cytochrome P460 family protein [Pseudomonadota bacterium]